MKLLILVIANDFAPYDNLQKWNWDRFMKLNPDLDCYYLKEKEDLDTEYKIDGINFYYKAKPDTFVSIFDKTISALRHLNYENYDFVLRTNLSSFFIRDKMMRYLTTLPKNEIYAGLKAEHQDFTFAAGAGFLMSKDVIDYLLNNLDKRFNLIDDVDIGKIMFGKYDITPFPRWDVPFNGDVTQIKNMGEDCFHIRIKTYVRQAEGPIYNYLYAKFYNYLE